MQTADSRASFRSAIQLLDTPSNPAAAAVAFHESRQSPVAVGEFHESHQSTSSTHAERDTSLAAALNNLASTYVSSQPLHAAELHQRALRLQKAAAESHPDEWTYRRDVALTLNNLGAAYL